jgi:hypothetical protein
MKKDLFLADALQQSAQAMCFLIKLSLLIRDSTSSCSRWGRS